MEGFQEFESPEIFCPRAVSEAPPQSGGAEQLEFSGIFDKVSSSGVV